MLRRTYVQMFVAMLVLGTMLVLGAPARAETFQQAVLDFSPTAFWEFKDASSANGATCASTVNNGTYQGTYDTGTNGGGVTLGPSGVPGLGQAAYFNNSPTQYASALTDMDRVVASDTGLPSGNSPRTIVWWQKLASTSLSLYPITWSYGTDAAHENVFTYIDTGSLKQVASTLSGGLSDGPVIDSNWHFLALTMGASSGTTSTWTVYLDGTAVTTGTGLTTGTNTANGAGPSGSDIIALGAFFGADYLNAHNSSGLVGALDEFAVIPSVLTADNIAHLYNSRDVPEPSTLVLAAVGLVGLLCYAWRKRR